MKKLLLVVGVLGALYSGAAMAANIEITADEAGTTGMGQGASVGDVVVNGTIPNQTCKISTSENNQYVITLDEIKQAELNNLDNTKLKEKAKSVMLSLTECGESIMGTKGTTFTKVQLIGDINPSLVEAVDDGHVLKNISTAANKAQNVYIQLLNGENNSQFKLGTGKGEGLGMTKDLSAANGRIDFNLAAAYYRKAGERATPGVVQGKTGLFFRYR